MRHSRLAFCLALALAAGGSGCGEAVVEPYDPALLGRRLPAVLAALTTGNPELALVELDKLAAQPDAPAGLDHFRGVALADAGRPEEAVAAFVAELAVHPGNALASALAAESLLSLGRLQAAREQLAAARRGLPDLPWLDFLAGREALLSEDDAGASAGFQRYLTSDPTSTRAAEAHHGLAQIARRQGNSAAARAHEELSQHLEQAGQFLNAHRQRLAESPGDAMAALGVGMVYLDLHQKVSADPGLLQQSAEAFEAALQRDPQLLKALYNLGFVRIRQGRNADAKLLLDRALAVDPEHAGVLLNSGLLARVVGDIDRALRHLERAALAAEDERAAIRPRLIRAELLEELGRLDEAAAELVLALELDPEDRHGVRARLDRLDQGR